MIGMDSIWAKTSPYMSLQTHLLTTGICAQKYLMAHSSEAITTYLAEKLSTTPNGAVAQVSYLCAVHDIGKAHPSFQQKDPLWARRIGFNRDELKLDRELFRDQFRHEYYSAEVMKRIWKQKGIPVQNRMLWATVLSLHHQKSLRDRSSLSDPRHPDWIMLQDALEKEMSDIFLGNETLTCPASTDAVCMLVTSLIILSDWVASSELMEDAEGKDIHAIEKQAENTLRLYGLISDQHFPEITDLHQMWPAVSQLRPIQHACDSLLPDAALTIIEAPMGEGKTEAALYLAARQCAASGRRGLYMALPSQATSNQMHERMDAMLEDIHYDQSRLLHGNAFLYENTAFHTEDELTALKWTRPTRMGLLGTNAVGTVDQAMAAVLLSKFSVIRLAGLMNKILIIDEIHAYDMYMSKILEILLCWCRDLNIPVILLSATLQAAQKKRYLACMGSDPELSSDYPLITQVSPNGETLQTPVKASSHYSYTFAPVYLNNQTEELAVSALSKVAKGGCYAILVNTVKRAQEVYQSLLQHHTDDVELFLFHGRFTVGDRERIEKKCVAAFGKDRSQRPKKAILVATQVVEQSIDLDFDGMISELAPVDLLLQRAGRLHRHRENGRPQGFESPVLEVLMPGSEQTDDLEQRYGNSGYVYEPFLLYNTEELLKVDKVVRIPEDIRGMIETVYQNVTDQNRASWLKRQFKGELEKTQAQGCSWPPPEAESFFPLESQFTLFVSDQDDGFEAASEASTRLGEKNVRIAFCTKDDYISVRSKNSDSETIRRIYMNSVSVRLPFALEEGEDICHIQHGKLAGIWCLNGESTVQIGKYNIQNDALLGISWRERS